jgi:hypothetical protein
VIFAALPSLPAMFVAAQLTACPAPQPRQVEMSFVNAAPILRTDKTSRDLGAFRVNTTFSHSQDETFAVGGLTISEFAPRYTIDFDTSEDPYTGKRCISIKSVKIEVNYAPTIYVAAESPEGSCHYKATLEHETRHVDTDIITFNELLPMLQRSVQDTINGLGALGPMPADDITAARDQLAAAVQQSLVAKADEIESARRSRQQMIDTRQEYMRLSEICANEQFFPQP